MPRNLPDFSSRSTCVQSSECMKNKSISLAATRISNLPFFPTRRIACLLVSPTEIDSHHLQNPTSHYLFLNLSIKPLDLTEPVLDTGDEGAVGGCRLSLAIGLCGELLPIDASLLGLLDGGCWRAAATTACVRWL